MDRGYDGNKIFQKLWGLGLDFVIRLTQKRKLFFHRKWVSATKLCVVRKGREPGKRYGSVLLFTETQVIYITLHRADPEAHLIIRSYRR